MTEVANRVANHEAAISAVLKRWTGREPEDLHRAAYSLGQLVAGPDQISCSKVIVRLRTAAEIRGYDTLPSEIETSVEAGMSAPRAIADALSPKKSTGLSIQATPYVWKETSEIPLRDFLYGKHIIRRYITTDIAPGGVGKSTQVIAEALAMCTGRPLLSDLPKQPLRVWLWNGEDPREEIERRVAAACAYYRISQTDIEGRLFVDSGREAGIVIASESRSGITIAEPVVDAVKQAILENEIDVFVVDPFVSSHAVSENDNNKIDAVAKQWSQIADETGCAIQVVHHVRKNGGREVEVEDARGAGALINASRCVRVLNPMTPEEANAAGLNRGDRFQFFRVTNGKVNLTLRSEHSDWRRLVSVPMRNGDSNPLGRPQDHVGVVTRWDWPDAASLVEDTPAGALEAIKRQIAGGDFREHDQSNDWAGIVVADILGIDLSDKEAKRRVKRMLTAWISAGHFEVVSRRDPLKRETKKFIGVKSERPTTNEVGRAEVGH